DPSRAHSPNPRSQTQGAGAIPTSRSNQPELLVTWKTPPAGFSLASPRWPKEGQATPSLTRLLLLAASRLVHIVLRNTVQNGSLSESRTERPRDAASKFVGAKSPN